MNELKIPKDSFFEKLKEDNEILNFGKPSRDIALRYVKEKRTAIDIGAHVGISVLHWASIFDKVYAFEPMIEHYNYLLENIKEFSNINCFNFAISNDETTKDAAYRTTKNSGSFQLLDSEYQQPSKKDPRQLYKVQTKKLDSFNFKDIDLIKIDVEGWELEALLGSKKTIMENSPVLIVEFTGGNYNKSLHRYNVEEYYNFINEIGYVSVGSHDDDIIYVKG